MDWFAARGLRHLVRRQRGLRPLGQEPPDQLRHLPTAPTTVAAREYIKNGAKRPRWSTASPRAHCAPRCLPQRHPERVARLALDAFVWTGEGKPDARRAQERSWPSSKRETAGRSTARSCTASSTRDHPGTADDGRRGIRRRDPRPRRLGSRPALRRHVLEAPAGGPGEGDGGDDRHARRIRWNRRKRQGSDRVFRAAAQRRQTIRRSTPGISHASFQQKNYMLVYHILWSFFTQPAPIYRG